LVRQPDAQALLGGDDVVGVLCVVADVDLQPGHACGEATPAQVEVVALDEVRARARREVAHDVATPNLLYELDEIAAAGGDVRARIFGA